MGHTGDADDDPGLARERAHLAWTRTAIAFAALLTSFLGPGTPGLVIHHH